jgi:hypothetical protein
VRYEVSDLSLDQVANLRNALYKLQNDGGPNGFEAIANMHGAPGLCPEGAGMLFNDQQIITRSLLSHMEKLIVAHVERLL